MQKIIKKLEKQFILCDAVEDPQTGQGVYSDDSGEGENDFNEEEVTDPEAEADSNLDAEPDQNTDTTYTDNGEMETVVDVPEGTNPIDPVPVETTPVEDEENQEDDPGADSDVTDDPNWGMDENGNYSGEGEGNIEEEEQDDESGDDEPTPDTPPQEERVVVEDGNCALGTFASIINKMLKFSVKDALQLAETNMRMLGINTKVSHNGLINGVNLNINAYLTAINRVNGLVAITLPRLSDSNINEVFRRGGQGIVYTGGTINGLDYGHVRHLLEYHGDGCFTVYDPTTGETYKEQFVGDNGGDTSSWRHFYWVLYGNK